MILKLFIVLIFLPLSFAMEINNAWPFLEKGDKVGVCFPSDAPLSISQIEAIEKFIKYQGLECTIINKDKSFDYYKDPIYRAEEFVKLLLDGTIKAIWCGLGGLGAFETMCRIERNQMLSKKLFMRKPIIGFGDSTYINLWCAKYGIPFIYGPFAGLGQELQTIISSTVNNLTCLSQVPNLLQGISTKFQYKFEILNGNIAKDIESTICGGNIAAIVKSHDWFPLDCNEKFVFLEEIMADPDCLNDLILSLSKKLNTAKAIFFGKIILTNNVKPESFIKNLNHLGNVPVLYNPNFGHGDHNSVLPFGTPAHLSPNGTLIINIKA